MVSPAPEPESLQTWNTCETPGQARSDRIEGWFPVSDDSYIDLTDAVDGAVQLVALDDRADAGGRTGID